MLQEYPLLSLGACALVELEELDGLGTWVVKTFLTFDLSEHRLGEMVGDSPVATEVADVSLYLDAEFLG